MNNISVSTSLPDSESGQPHYNQILRRTLAISLPLFALAVGVSAIILYFANQAEQDARLLSEQHSVSMYVGDISQDIASITADLDMLVNNRELQNLWDEQGRPNSRSMDNLASDFLAMVRARKLYNQIRLLDVNGMEMVRVNYSNGRGEVVSAAQLQDKKGRYYFEEAMRLRPGAVFVSPLDLNVEHGEIEQPLKPMIRFASLVVDQAGHKRGVILLNYFANHLIKRLSVHAEMSPGSIPMMLNSDGYWLKGRSPQDEWGFMYKQRSQRRFGNDYPQAWKVIQSSDSGQLKTADGLFTYNTIYPLLADKVHASDVLPAAHDYHWKVISFVPDEGLYAAQYHRYQVVEWILLVLALVLLSISWRSARSGFYRHQAEQQIIRLNQVIEGSLNEITMFDCASLGFVFVNRGALLNLGYSRAEMLELTPLDLMPSLTKEEFRQRLQPLCSGEQTRIEFTTRHRRKDGSCYEVEIQIERVPDDPPMFVAFIMDISERLKHQQSLREANLVMESSMAVLFRWQASGGWPVEMVSENISQYGYQPDEFLSGGRDYSSIIYPPDAKRVSDEVKHYTDLGTSHFEQEYRIVAADGEVFWVNDQTVAVYDDSGQVTHYLGVIYDITERKQMEQELRKLAQAVEQSPESIVITNINAEIEYVNEAFVQNTGYQREEVMGQNPRVLHSGETPPETYTDMWETLTAGRAWKGEFYNKRKNGTVYVEFVHIAPIRQQDGTITHYLAIKEDITEKKRLGLELDHHRHHLEEQVEQRTAQLQDALHRAEAANRAKSTFLANMSHEIRTPMNTILGLTHLLQQAELTPEQHERLYKIDVAANHLLSLINDILDLSKIEAEKMTLEQNDFELNAMLQRIKTLLQEQVDAKGLMFEVGFLDEDLWVRGDETRLTQAALNYVGNAIKFTHQGGILFRVRILRESEEEVYLRFEVEDSGIGLEQDKLNRLFDAFEQADLSITRKYGGTGLGLAITRHLAKMMGGETGAESEPGRGSTFWFTACLKRSHQFAKVERKAENFSDAEQQLRSHYQGARILLVEDNEINLEVAGELLRYVKLNVDTAVNGREAVGKVISSDYDLILMDVQMPEMDGLEATTVIRSMKGLEQTPIVAMTANIFEEDRQACLQAGMNDFVAKPVIPQNLFSTLIKWLKKTTVAADSSPGNPASGARLLDTPVSPQDGSEPESSLINFQSLTNMFGNDRQKHLGFLRKFAVQAQDMADELEQALQQQDIPQVAFLAHKLKSSARAVGADSLADLCLQLEQAGRESDRQAVENLMPEIRPLAQKLADEIGRM